jgi:hypothetical protein
MHVLHLIVTASSGDDYILHSKYMCRLRQIPPVGGGGGEDRTIHGWGNHYTTRQIPASFQGHFIQGYPIHGPHSSTVFKLLYKYFAEIHIFLGLFILKEEKEALRKFL